MAQEEEEQPETEESEEQQPSPPPPEGQPEEAEAQGGGGRPDETGEPDRPVNPNAKEKVFKVGDTFKVKPFAAAKDRVFRRGSGRRSRSRINGMQGRYVKSSLPRGRKDVALDATLRAAAPYQQQRRSSCAVALLPEDIREKVRERRIGNFLLFVVDASGSMGARGRST